MDNKSKTFTDLIVWQKGHQLVLDLYKTTNDFPREELFGLTSQMRRCVVSITSNIAEGFGRKSYKEKINFFFVSKGSLVELQNQLIISKDIGFLDENKFNIIYNQSVEVHKILNSLITKSRTQL
jgi:four helix bundle protein